MARAKVVMERTFRGSTRAFRGLSEVVLAIVLMAALTASCSDTFTAPTTNGPPTPDGSGDEPAPPEEEPAPDEVTSVRIVDGPRTLVQGDPASFEAEGRTASGNLVENASTTWSIAPRNAGLVTAEGRFVGYTPGEIQLIASVGTVADTAELMITERSVPSGQFMVTGRGLVQGRFTSDLWVHGNVAYTGTLPGRLRAGNVMYAWDVSDPANPRLADSVVVDAETVNDVKIREDGTLAVITHELGTVGGISLLDLTDPMQPQVIRFFSDGMESGVHNVWIDGAYVYAAVDGNGRGLRIIDVSDLTNPAVIASPSYSDDTFLHDVYVRNGLAFLSNWTAGLVIVDVGNGLAGGAPDDPHEVARIRFPDMDVHNAWYWPEASYVFLGDELDVTSGQVRVVDVSDLRNPRAVASYRLFTGQSPHNFWIDEERGILYMAYYGSGLHAIDVTGELLGDLEQQNREVAQIQYDGGPGCFPISGSGTCTWAPQLHGDYVFVSDINSGLWVLDVTF